MKLRSLPARRVLVLLSLGMASLSGCGDDGMSKRYSVSGMVKYKGAPVEKGEISFIAVAPDGRSAMGQIDKGYYTMTTQEPGDGVVPGAYDITIVAKTVDFTDAEAEAKKKGNTAAYIPQGMATAAFKKAPNAVPDKYSSRTTSGLKFEVKPQASKDVNFDLVD